MKYLLCLKRFYHRKSDFEEIKVFLDGLDCNNLKNICEFTMQFANVQKLKEYLLSKGLIDKKDLKSDTDICITYYYNSKTKVIKVPYQIDSKFFNIPYLAEAISKEVENNPSFMDNFRIRKYLPDVFYELRNERWNLNTYSKVQHFIEFMCYSKGKFSYKSLYDMAIIMGNINRLKQTNSICSINKVPTTSGNNLNENATEEPLKRVRTLTKNTSAEIEGQLSIFKK